MAAKRHQTIAMNYLHITLFLVLSNLTVCQAAELVFQDRFTNKLDAGWTWLREQTNAWRVSERGLEIRMLPGNMWGPANNARNVLVHPVPDPATNEIAIGLSLENRPAEQYEQVDLVWYYDDGHMVKLGQELVDGKLSIVMGREEDDRTRTIAIIPLDSFPVQLRLTAKGQRIRGDYRTPKDKDWQAAGECDLPVKGVAKASVQCYQGPATIERWARITEFRIERGTP
jgi:regulation of enolase protein 1 (concanavalin A-like superfamily)